MMLTLYTVDNADTEMDLKGLKIRRSIAGQRSSSSGVRCNLAG